MKKVTKFVANLSKDFSDELNNQKLMIIDPDEIKMDIKELRNVIVKNYKKWLKTDVGKGIMEEMIEVAKKQNKNMIIRRKFTIDEDVEKDGVTRSIDNITFENIRKTDVVLETMYIGLAKEIKSYKILADAYNDIIDKSIEEQDDIDRQDIKEINQQVKILNGIVLYAFILVIIIFSVVVVVYGIGCIIATWMAFYSHKYLNALTTFEKIKILSQYGSMSWVYVIYWVIRGRVLYKKQKKRLYRYKNP